MQFGEHVTNISGKMLLLHSTLKTEAAWSAISIYLQDNMVWHFRRQWLHCLPACTPARLPAYLLTQWKRILLVKLIRSQLVKKFPAFYGTRRLITVFTSDRHLSIYCASSIQSTPLHSTSWRSILILSSHLRLGLSSGLFPLRFPHKTMYIPLLSSYVLHAPSIFLLSILSPEQYWVSSTDH